MFGCPTIRRHVATGWAELAGPSVIVTRDDVQWAVTNLFLSLLFYSFKKQSSLRPYVGLILTLTSRQTGSSTVHSATGRKRPILDILTRIYRGILFTIFPVVDPTLEFRHTSFAPVPASLASPVWDESEGSWKYNGKKCTLGASGSWLETPTNPRLWQAEPPTPPIFDEI